MARKFGIAAIGMGAALLLTALLLLWYNHREDADAGEASRTLMEDIELSIAEGSAEESDSEDDLPVVWIDGYDYIGYLEIPSIDRTLPVMAEWDYQRLRLSPCRQFGSVETNDLVIAAHNYDSHFGRLKELAEGAEVVFTDMEGTITRYAVTQSSILQPDEVDAVQNSGHDLVLYTCTKGGKTRVTVFCDRVQE